MDSSIRSSYQRPEVSQGIIAKISEEAKGLSRPEALSNLGSALRLKFMNNALSLPKLPAPNGKLLAFLPAFKKAATLLLQTPNQVSEKTAKLQHEVRSMIFGKVVTSLKIALSKLTLKFDVPLPSISSKKVSEMAGQLRGKVGDLGGAALSAANTSAQRVYANLQTALDSISKKESPHQQEVNAFLEQFDAQISQEEQKLTKLKNELPTLTKELDIGDTKQKIATLTDTIVLMKSIRGEVQKSGTKVLEKMHNERANDLAGAKAASRATIDQGREAVSTFVEGRTELRKVKKDGKEYDEPIVNKGCQELLSKVPIDDNKKAELGRALDEARTACLNNLEACETRQPALGLWGLLAVWKPGVGTGKLTTEKLPSAREMANKSTTPSRLNSSEVMPAFIEKFQSEVMMEKVFEPRGLERPGGSQVVEKKKTEPDEKKETEPDKKKETESEATKRENKNRAIFMNMAPNPEAANKLYEDYKDLWAAYGSRGADPQKYLNMAHKFMDNLNSFQPMPKG